jgi:hypothetical protein
MISRGQFHLLRLFSVCAAALAAGSLFGAAAVSPVKVWEEKTVIPTYPAGAPELNPMFFFGRASQGAQAPVYPYPMYDSLTGKKVDKTYTGSVSCRRSAAALSRVSTRPIITTSSTASTSSSPP